MIYLVRHGLDNEKYVGGWSHIDLVPEGIQQVNKTSDFISKNLSISQIYSSDIKRAVTTAEIIGVKIKKPIIYTEKLRELNKGLLTGMSVDLAQTLYPEFFSNVKINSKYPSGESMIDLYERIKKLIIDFSSLDNTLLVTHRGVINMIYFIFNNQKLDMDKKQFGVTHASIHEMNIHTQKIKKYFKGGIIMAQIVSKIVLTGGPCGGKTTALARIEEELSEKGYRVFVVSESASELIKGGIRPFGDLPFNIIEFQKLILKYQLMKEQVYEHAIHSLPEDDKCVIIYDRGLLDNKAYVTNNQFAEILKNFDYNEFDMIDSYDMIIHLVTAADGKEEYYSLSNNIARSETPEQARTLDKKTISAWLGHKNLKIIDNGTDFIQKLNRVMDCVYDAINNPIPNKTQRQFEIDIKNSNFDFITNSNFNVIHIEEVYFKDLKLLDYKEGVLRKKVYRDQIAYYLTLKTDSNDENQKVMIDKKISKKEYLKILSFADNITIVQQKRFSFVRDQQYFELDIFEDKEYAVLKINPTDKNQKIRIPKELSVIKEITKENLNLNSYYKNNKIYQKVSI